MGKKDSCADNCMKTKVVLLASELVGLRLICMVSVHSVVPSIPVGDATLVTASSIPTVFSRSST